MDVRPSDFESLRRFGQEQAAEAADLRLKVRWLEAQNRRLDRRLNRVYRSWTWRIGRVVLFPYHLFQWLLERLRRSPFDK
jgi:hypothetical protein